MNNKKETKMNLYNELAELEHEQWIAWSKNITETEKITSERLERWKKLWRPYSELTESEKDQDREWAQKALKIVKKHLGVCEK